MFLAELGIKILLRFFFGFIGGGESCVICGQKTFLYPICKSCRISRLTPDLQSPRCSICGKILLSTKDTCFKCRENAVIKSIDRLLPLFPYRIWNKELMFMWKSQEIRSLSLLFASILNRVLKQEEVEFIVPVPPRKGKIQEKGWDQIDELCNLLEFIYGFKILRLLERSTTLEQKKLGREGRLEQIGKAYHLKSYGKSYPQKVYILDDVCTTGSTLESCARILKEEAQIPTVNAISLFIVE